MPVITKISKDSLVVGKHYVPNIPRGRKLYWNDNERFGLELQEYINGESTYQGKLASGELDGSKPVRISDLLPMSPGYIQLEGTKIGGVQQEVSTVGISLELFEKYFVPAAFPPT